MVFFLLLSKFGLIFKTAFYFNNKKIKKPFGHANKNNNNNNL